MGLDLNKGPLELLAASSNGVTESLLIAHGVTIAQMVELVRAGLAMRRDRARRRGSQDDGSRDGADHRRGAARAGGSGRAGKAMTVKCCACNE